MADLLEDRTQAYGREILARLESPSPILLTPAWWDERLMEWSMSDPAVKVQLFRFIDVLPTLLPRPQEVGRHLREYLNEAEEHLPRWARILEELLPRGPLASRFLAWLARVSALRMAHRFVAGSTVDEALQAVAELRRRRLAFTVDLLGEATVTEPEADRYQASYLELLAGLGAQVNHWPEIPLIDRDHQGPVPRVNVSLKLSGLFSQFDPIAPDAASRAVRERLRPILRSARQVHAHVNLDMEQYAVKDLTLKIFRDVLEEDEFRDWPNMGLAIQGYLRDTEKDLHELAAWARQRGTSVKIRLIKGAYWDYETVLSAQEHWPVPVFTRKWETDANYEKLTRFLLENHQVLRPAFGSHNVRSMAHVLAAAEVLGVPADHYELQVLYGMSGPLPDALASLGRRVRVYTPYGQLLPGMAYLVRRLLENTANESFLRASFTEHVGEEKLLMNPQRLSVVPGSSSVDGKPNGQPTPAQFQNEPLVDFSKEENRAEMAAALAAVRRQFGKTYPLGINHRQVATEQFIDSLNPSHAREIVGCCGRATPEQARQAVAAAKAAFSGWRETDPEERASLLENAAEGMRERRFELSAWIVHESAKPWREADADVAEAIDFCSYYAGQMRQMAHPQRFDLPGEDNEYFYEPRGITVVIAPWNFPLAILCGMTAAALVAGNPVIMKPAEQSAVIAAKLMEIFQKAGFPPGVVNYLPGVGEEIGPVLVEHPDVALIAFTGSRGVGMLINKQAAVLAPGQDHIKRVIAELGGKNAIIVDDDADPDEAVKGVVASAFGYQGQKCSACSRAIVLASIYDAFLERLVEATKSLTVAPAEDPGCGVGPVIDAEARDRIVKYIEKGKLEARLAYAGDAGKWKDEGFYVAPHIFADVAPTATIAQEEIFGPVLAVMKAGDLEEALRIANGTSYALTGGLFSRSPEHIRLVKNEFRVGNLYINRKITGALVARQPFGGFKLSGIGSKAGGPDYLLQFVVPRAITENTLRRGFAPTS